MKSAIGIGSLLMDGLGDTIRVSLTEDPEYEIDPCRRCGCTASTSSDTPIAGRAGDAAPLMETIGDPQIPAAQGTMLPM